MGRSRGARVTERRPGGEGVGLSGSVWSSLVGCSRGARAAERRPDLGWASLYGWCRCVFDAACRLLSAASGAVSLTLPAGRSLPRQALSLTLPADRSLLRQAP